MMKHRQPNSPEENPPVVVCEAATVVASLDRHVDSHGSCSSHSNSKGCHKTKQTNHVTSAFLVPCRRRRCSFPRHGRWSWRYNLVFVVLLAFPLLGDNHRLGTQHTQAAKSKASSSSLALFPFNVTESSAITTTTTNSRRCALNLYGLHRAFSSLVLPSLEKHVIPYNPHCDYFVHTYNLPQEMGGRSGQGGILEAPESVLQALRTAVHKVDPDALVELQADTMNDFEHQRKHVIDQVLTTFVTPEGTIVSSSHDNNNHTHNSNDQNVPLFFPQADRTYKFPHTILNILKMWHSQESVWKLMESHEAKRTKENRNLNHHPQQYYESVGMLRSDVVYMTPLSIRHHPPNTVVIPAFARWPVSDRLIYGPRAGVEPWARHRFDHLDVSVQVFGQNPKLKDHMMQSELFVQNIVFPQITTSSNNQTSSSSSSSSYQIVEHPTNCFLRARADGTVWISDCTTGNPAKTVYEAIHKQYHHPLHTTLSSSSSASLSWTSWHDWRYYFTWKSWQRKAHAVLAYQLEQEILQRPCGPLHMGEGRPKRVEMTCSL